MKKILKHFVVFMYRGSFVSETEEKEIKSREEISLPLHAYCYYFFDREDVVDGKEIFVGKKINETGCFYPNGELYTLAKVKKEMPQEHILISNMECNKWDAVVKSRKGNFIPFNKKVDKII